MRDAALSIRNDLWKAAPARLHTWLDARWNAKHVFHVLEQVTRAAVPYASDIPYDLAVSAFSGTSHVPEQRADGVLREYSDHLVRLRELLERAATTPEARERVLPLWEGYRAAYRTKYLDRLRAHGGIVSAMVAGPANFPTSQMEKRHGAMEKRSQDMLDWIQRAQAELVKALTKTSIEAQGGTIAALERDLAERQATQEAYKAINAIVRRKVSDVAKLEAIVAATGYAPTVAARFLKPDPLGRIGAPGSTMSNNLAQIKRLQARILEETARAATKAGEFPFDGGVVEYDPAAESLRIFFDERPPREKYEEMRRAGFVVTRTGVYQRKLTQAAVYAAARMTGIDLPRIGES